VSYSRTIGIKERSDAVAQDDIRRPGISFLLQHSSDQCSHLPSSPISRSFIAPKDLPLDQSINQSIIMKASTIFSTLALAVAALASPVVEERAATTTSSTAAATPTNYGNYGKYGTVSVVMTLIQSKG
jgi:hypothetical protein